MSEECRYIEVDDEGEARVAKELQIYQGRGFSWPTLLKIAPNGAVYRLNFKDEWEEVK